MVRLRNEKESHREGEGRKERAKEEKHCVRVSCEYESRWSRAKIVGDEDGESSGMRGGRWGGGSKTRKEKKKKREEKKNA